MDYGEVLGRAWKTIWKHKILWLFGLFASCTAGGGGFSGGGSSDRSPHGSSADIWPDSHGTFNDSGRFFNDVGHTFANMDAWVWVLIGMIFVALILVLSLLKLAVATVGRSGMVKGVWQADEGAEKLTFMEVLRASLPCFWRVFLLYFLSGIAIALVFIILIFFVILASIFTLGIGLFLMLPAMIILIIPACLFVWVMQELATIAIVAEDQSLIESIKRAWQILAGQPLPLVLMSIILGIGKAFVGLLIKLPYLLAMIPFGIGLFAGRESGDWVLIGGIFSLACCCLILPFYLFLQGVLESYVKSSWTLTYRRLNGLAAIEAE